MYLWKSARNSRKQESITSRWYGLSLQSDPDSHSLSPCHRSRWWPDRIRCWNRSKEIFVADGKRIFKQITNGAGQVKQKIENLNNFFTRNTFRHLIDGKPDNVYSSVVERYISNTEDQKTNGELIREIYKELKDNYRNEYFYKNTLLNKLLLDDYDLNTATAITELPIAKSKADFILINDNAVIYEIKTELDNLDRLHSQIDDYYKGFDHVAVVTYKKNLNSLRKVLAEIGKPVGIYILKKDSSLSTIRKPQSYTDNLDKEIMFKILRKGEQEEIIMHWYGYLPNVTQFQYYDVWKKMFANISIEESYPLVLKELKKRNQQMKEELIKVPYELKFLAYFMNLKKKDYKNLESFLERKYE